MKFAYKFSNLLGTVYRKGDLLFSPDGNSVISTVGNRISIFDLRNNKSSTLPVESRFNYNALDISPNGCTLIAINEEGDAHMISLISQTVVHKYRFKRKVSAVKFSPDGKHFAVCKENNVMVFKAPGPFTGQYNAFVMERVFHGAYDETTCLDWSFDSRILAVGSLDMATKLYPMDKWANFRIYSLGNHTDSIVGCFFEENSYDITTISRNGQTCVWECTVNPNDLIPLDKAPKKKKKARKSSDSEEDDIDVTKSLERSEAEISAALSQISMDEQEENVDKELNKFFYKRVAKHYLADEARKEDKAAMLTSAAYHKKSKILVTGFSNGCFFIYEMPEVNIIHSLNISEQKISAIAMNNTGDWIALGCSGLGQLLVWEWQSETYVMKQQGHANNMNCVAYSNDGQIVATGGEDGKVKLWNTTSGFCFVTFSEHSGAVTGLAFCAQKNFLVSTSLDGTARAYDIIRYRNFRTFTSPRPVEFSCVAVDSSGEFVVAGGQDVFDIYLWAVKTGRLLEILSGHEGPVGGLSFTTNPTSTVLASASWDGTLRIWDALEKGSAHETIQIGSDGLCVAFRPDSAEEVAVATLDGQVTVFNAKTANQVASINGKNDLQSGRSETDLITAKKSQEAKAFTSICYSADGQYLLAGGQSKNVCIYNVKEGLLVKTFEITQNRSFDAVDDFINRRKMTQFGNVALVEEREAREGGNVAIKLPGVRKGDMASRVHKPEVRVFSLIFSPTGQQWAAATTEGLLIYGLNSGLVFDPFDLELDVTPAALRKALQKKDHVNGLIMALKLNEANLIQEAIESIPVKDIELTVLNLAPRFVERTLVVVATALESSHHLEFYLTWAQQILSTHGPRLRIAHITPTLLSLHKSLLKNYQQLSHICDFNKYTMKYVANLGEVAEKKLTQKMEASDAEDDGALSDEYMVEEVNV